MGQREERLGVGRLRKDLGPAIDDGPALGPEGNSLGMLTLGHPGTFVVLDDLEKRQPAENPEEGTREARRENKRSGSQARGAGSRHGGGAASPRFMLADHFTGGLADELSTGRTTRLAGPGCGRRRAISEGRRD